MWDIQVECRRQPDGIPTRVEWARSHVPCIPYLLMAKDFKASVLHVSELSIALPWIPKNSPQYWIALVIKLLTKNTKTYTIWLEMIARVLNMPIGLKGNNYYSKVFKRVNCQLWNNTFWVVIKLPRSDMSGSSDSAYLESFLHNAAVFSWSFPIFATDILRYFALDIWCLTHLS